MHIALTATEKAVASAGDLPFAPPVYGLAAFGLLIGLLLVTYAFRSVGSRH